MTNRLGSGFVESIYRNALVIAIGEKGLEVSAEQGFEVNFRVRKIGIFVPDLIKEAQADFLFWSEGESKC